MQDHLTTLGNGVVAALGQDLTTEVLKTKECHQLIKGTADTIAKCGAGAIGLAVAAAPVVLPVAIGGGVVAGFVALLNWLDKPKPAATKSIAPAPAVKR